MSTIKDWKLEEIADKSTLKYIQNYTMFPVDGDRFKALYTAFINFYHEVKLVELEGE